MCYLSSYETIRDKIRIISEIVITIWSVVYLAIAARELSFLGWKIFKENMILCPSRVLFLIACFLMQFCVPLRLACKPLYEDQISIIVMFFIGFYFLFFCR